MGAAENESGDSTGWKRLVSVAFLVQFFSMMGVSVVYAFLPLYVESLGIESEGRAAFWAGFLLFSQAIMVAVASPIWGSMADRYGAKLMLIRALLGCGTVWVLISFATSVYQLLPLFLLTGLFSGINTAMTNLVSGSVPRAKLGTAIGTVQTGVATGTADAKDQDPGLQFIRHRHPSLYRRPPLRGEHGVLRLISSKVE